MDFTCFARAAASAVLYAAIGSRRSIAVFVSPASSVSIASTSAGLSAGAPASASILPTCARYASRFAASSGLT